MIGEFEVHTVGARFRWRVSCSARIWTRPPAFVDGSGVTDRPGHRTSRPVGPAERRRRSQVFAQLFRPGIRRERAQQLAGQCGVDLGRTITSRWSPPTMSTRWRSGCSRVWGRSLRVVDSTVEIAHCDLSALTATLRTHAPGQPSGIGAPAPGTRWPSRLCRPVRWCR